MTMTLQPKKETDFAPDYPVGFWSYLMFDLKCGEAINLRKHETDPHKFYYDRDKQGFCPMYNDGFLVDSKAANKMADIAEKAEVREGPKDAVSRFISFCRQSGGFEIH